MFCSVSITSGFLSAFSLEWTNDQMKIVYPSTWKASSPSGEWTLVLWPIVHAFFKIVSGDFANTVNSDKASLVEHHPKGLVSLDKMGTIFSSLRDNNRKVIVIGDDKQLLYLSLGSISSVIYKISI